MTTKTALEEKNNKKVLKLKAFIEEMELQFSLGKSELMDEIEVQKKSLEHFINEQKENISLAERTNEIKGFFEELQLQLALGKAESNDILEDQRKNIIKKINSIEDVIHSYKNKAEDKQESFFEVFGFKTYKLITLMEITRIEFKFDNANLKDKIVEIKKDLSNKLQSIKEELENDAGIIEEEFNTIKSSMVSIFKIFFSDIKHDDSKIDTHVSIHSQQDLEKQRNSVIVEPDAKPQDVLKTDK